MLYQVHYIILKNKMRFLIFTVKFLKEFQIGNMVKTGFDIFTPEKKSAIIMGNFYISKRGGS